MDPRSLPAFPVSTGDPDGPYQNGRNTAQFPGISRRDYFAAKAMQAHITASFQALAAQYANDPDAINRTIAKAAYEAADAMLAAR